MENWIDAEIENSVFSDKRLASRLKKILNQFFAGFGGSIPAACQDWKNTKAAYRFFANKNLTETAILEGHFQATKIRAATQDETLLILHDTCEITYNRKSPEKVGYTRKCANRKGLFDQVKQRAMCGILMHSSLVLTNTGVPLGFAAKKFWNRKKFKGAKSLYRTKNATRIPIEKKESFRWIEGISNSNKLLGKPNRLVHIGDREADIYELFYQAPLEGSSFLIRSKVDRRTENEEITINDVLKKTRPRGKHTIFCWDKNGRKVAASLSIKFEKIRIKPSFGPKTKLYPDVEVYIIHAEERGKSRNREPINWKLITNIPIRNLSEAVEKLRWYALRWKIEVFFKILKSGCNVANAKLRGAENLCKLLSIYCILAWRIFWMTMLQREPREIAVEKVLTKSEVKILDKIEKPTKAIQSLSDYLLKIARLGGYLGRSADGPPGNQVFWRGWKKLMEIQFGIRMHFVGN